MEGEITEPLQKPSDETLNNLISGEIHFHCCCCTLHKGLLEKLLSCSESANVRIIEIHFRKNKLFAMLGGPNLQKLRRLYCLFLELREQREKENVNFGQRGQNAYYKGKMLNVFLK